MNINGFFQDYLYKPNMEKTAAFQEGALLTPLGHNAVLDHSRNFESEMITSAKKKFQAILRNYENLKDKDL